MRTEALERYRGDQPWGMVADLVVAAPDDDAGVWIPQGDAVAFRPLLFNVTEGYFVNLLRVRRSGILSRHRHTGPVHAFVLRGRWHYLEHDWEVSAGDYAFEPPGEIHTLEVPADVDEMQTLFHVTGSYLYVDPEGRVEGVEDVFTKLARARDHFEQQGWDLGRLEALVR